MKSLKLTFSILVLFSSMLNYIRAQDIHDAVKKNDVAAVKSLLDKDASLVNARDTDGRLFSRRQRALLVTCRPEGRYSPYEIGSRTMAAPTAGAVFNCGVGSYTHVLA